MWNKLKQLAMHSETIAWARIQFALGLVAGAVTYVDPSIVAPILPPAWVPWLIAANGIFSEYLRRRRDTLKAQAKVADADPHETARGV